MARIVRADPYLTREDTGADEGRTPAVQHYEKQNGSDGATSNTVFTLSKSYVTGSNTLMVFVNGQKAELLVTATDETEYEETNGTTVTFGASLLDADVVEFIIVGTYFIQDTDNFVTKSEQNNENYIINGDFEIHQRAISAATMTSGTYRFDRWEWIENCDASIAMVRGATVPTLAQSGNLSGNSGGIDTTVGDATIAAGQYACLQQKIEGYNLRSLWGKECTLSFWHRHYDAGTYSICLRSGSDDASYIMEYTQTVADIWEKATLTFTLDDTIGTWDYDDGVGVKVGFPLASGSTFTTSTLDTWVSGNYLASTNQVNAISAAASVSRLSQVKLELGPVATLFVPRPIQEELALCQRYYQKSYQMDVDPGSATTVGSSICEPMSTLTRASIQNGAFAVQMVGTPTITMYDQLGTVDTVSDYNNSANTYTVSSVAGKSARVVGTYLVTSGNMLADIEVLAHFTADAEL